MAKTILTKNDSVKAVILQDRLANDYLPYFTALSKSEFVFDAENKRIVLNTTARIKRAISLIARVFLGQGITTPTAKELGNLNQILEEINIAHDDISARTIEYAGLKAALEDTTELTAISPAELSLAVSLSRKEKKKFEQKGRGRVGGVEGVIGRILKGVGLGTVGQLAGAGIASQFAATLMGPYATPAMLLGGYQALRLGGWGVKKGLGGIRWGAGKAYGGVQEMFRRRTPPTGDFSLPALESTPVSQPLSGAATAGQPRDFLGQFLPKSEKRGKRTKRELMYLAAPINYFFDKQANKAKWTKDLLKSVKQIARIGRGKGGEGLGLGDIALGTTIGGVLAKGLVGFLSTATIPVLTVAVAAGGAIIITKILGGIEKEVSGIDAESLRLQDVLLSYYDKAYADDPIKLYNAKEKIFRERRRVLNRQYQLSKIPGGKSMNAAKAAFQANEVEYAEFRKTKHPTRITPIPSTRYLEDQLRKPPVFRYDVPDESLNPFRDVDKWRQPMYPDTEAYKELIEEQKKTNDILNRKLGPVDQPGTLDEKNISRELSGILGMHEQPY